VISALQDGFFRICISGLCPNIFSYFHVHVIDYSRSQVRIPLLTDIFLPLSKRSESLLGYCSAIKMPAVDSATLFFYSATRRLPLKCVILAPTLIHAITAPFRANGNMEPCAVSPICLALFLALERAPVLINVHRE